VPGVQSSDEDTKKYHDRKVEGITVLKFTEPYYREHDSRESRLQMEASLVIISGTPFRSHLFLFKGKTRAAFEPFPGYSP
jgi:hypothetical protein